MWGGGIKPLIVEGESAVVVNFGNGSSGPNTEQQRRDELPDTDCSINVQGREV